MSQGVKIQRRRAPVDAQRDARLHEMRKKKQDLLSRANYATVFATVVLPLLAILYLVKTGHSLVPSNKRTLYFCVAYYNITMLAFTCGYHKLYAHASFRPKYQFLHFYFLVFGSAVGLGSVRWWALLHRAHHQYTDDPEKDPYSIKRGLLWAHWGWLLKKPKTVALHDGLMEHEFPEVANDAHERLDLREWVLWQERHFWLFFSLTTCVVPVLFTVYVCGDLWVHGAVYPGILRMFMCQQLMLATELVCHARYAQISLPTQPYSDKNSLVDCVNPLVLLLTYGQLLQNFHHEFAHDYRGTLLAWAYDPTKWLIALLWAVGLVEDVLQSPAGLVMQLRIQQQQLVLNRMRSQLNWGTPISRLPKITTREFRKLSRAPDNQRIYIVIQNIIHDITPFMDQHPGGIALLRALHGKDATRAFYGGVYGHSTAAVNLLATMRIGVLDQGNDEDVWRRVAREEAELQDERGPGLYKTAEAA